MKLGPCKSTRPDKQARTNKHVGREPFKNWQTTENYLLMFWVKELGLLGQRSSVLGSLTIGLTMDMKASHDPGRPSLKGHHTARLNCRHANGSDQDQILLYI